MAFAHLLPLAVTDRSGNRLCIYNSMVQIFNDNKMFS